MKDETKVDKTIDFHKEIEIRKIAHVLRTWPVESVSFVREALEHPPQAVISNHAN